MKWQPKLPITSVYTLLEADICSLCGACVAACYWGALYFNPQQPSQLARENKLCVNCSRCVIVCPQATLWARKDLYHEDVKVLDAFHARSKNKDVLSRAQDGGVTTTLAMSALEKGLVDAVVLAGTEDKWVPKPVLAFRAEDVLGCSKSKYFYVPSLVELGRLDNVNKIMVVGLPCQIRAVERLAELDVGISRKVAYKVGLFCAHNVDYSSMIEKLAPKAGVNVNRLVKIDIKRRLIFYDKEGKSYELPLSEFESLTRPSCLQCPEFVSRGADINVGFRGASEGWNMVLVMSKLGERLFNEVMDGFEVKKPSSEDLSRVYDMDRKKREKAGNYFMEFYGAGLGDRFLDYATWRVICR
ncbi:MAG: Coenzyme F420 hydrogenase/dehydrogenase, beta subunit C-terminal domain [Candidatus Nezhaarchaeota archaeon]|nr:Coenzyme F420 hydrogenase/dehydrogenase, beta subunit C-terminal domain [Candidatus Nezhaarchaeota archaeon]